MLHATQASVYLDSHLSYQRACLHAIDYLTKFGYSAIQAYMILGAAPIDPAGTLLLPSRRRACRPDAGRRIRVKARRLPIVPTPDGLDRGGRSYLTRLTHDHEGWPGHAVERVARRSATSVPAA